MEDRISITRLALFVFLCLMAGSCFAGDTDIDVSNLPLTHSATALAVASFPEIRLQRPPSLCRVAPLAEIEDRDALELEAGIKPEGVVELSGVAPELARALTRFKDLLTRVGGSIELQSAYRPEAYQEHLAAVWSKWMLELRFNRQPACQALRMEVGEEFARHKLMPSQRPVTTSDHTRGLAFDAAVKMPRLARLKGRRVSLDSLALQAGIRRPDVRRDPVHFRLVVTPASTATDPPSF